MSWQVASFLILGVVLLGGFAWYERSRPPSQVVALVAALAALAIAGRIAFAAFPNVKPTTDIVVFAGYALGPAPGFAVGAFAGLVSNFWFGQGPWTPWQMAGWGMCGLLGAALALGVRNAGRFSLAAVCGFAGIAYGLLLNFSLMATYGGDLSIQRFLTLEARAIPFDAAHAIGNVAFALLAGPAMVRMLGRFRARFEWRTPALASAILLILMLPAFLPAPAQASDLSRATTWLESAQSPDGGFGASAGSDSSASITGWAMLGLEAAGRNPFDVSHLGKTPIDFLRGNLDEVSSSGDLARTIVALEGAGADPHSFGGRNLVEELRTRRAANGSFEGWPGTTSFSAIALRVAGATGGLDATLSWLSSVQNDDGGWGDLPSQPPSNADVTGSVLQAIPSTKAAQGGLSYLRKHQHSGGGFSIGSSGPVNSQSTAWAIQGMIAAGADPATIDANGSSGLDYLATLQEDDGHYRYSASSDQTPVWVTSQVLVAIADESLPIAPPAREKETATVEPSKGLPPVPGVGSGAPAPPSTVPPAESPDEGAGTGGSPTAPVPPATSRGQGPPIMPGSGGTPEAEEEGIPPEATAPVSTPVATADDPPSPLPPIGIGLTAGALALGVPWWLGRRYGW
jgi:energy-coupling factor transport system substrate-specific component